MNQDPSGLQRTACGRDLLLSGSLFSQDEMLEYRILEYTILCRTILGYDILPAYYTILCCTVVYHLCILDYN